MPICVAMIYRVVRDDLNFFAFQDWFNSIFWKWISKHLFCQIDRFGLVFQDQVFKLILVILEQRFFLVLGIHFCSLLGARVSNFSIFLKAIEMVNQIDCKMDFPGLLQMKYQSVKKKILAPHHGPQWRIWRKGKTLLPKVAKILSKMAFYQIYGPYEQKKRTKFWTFCSKLMLLIPWEGLVVPEKRIGWSSREGTSWTREKDWLVSKRRTS